MINGPIYEHDCDNCVYLGTEFPNKHDGTKSNAVDMYACASRIFGATVIRRFRSSPEGYSSMPLPYAKRFPKFNLNIELMKTHANFSSLF